MKTQEITNHDILDLVTVTVNDIRSYDPDGVSIPASDVRLSSDDILIGDKPVPIDDIKANMHNAKGFVKLIKAAM